MEVAVVWGAVHASDGGLPGATVRGDVDGGGGGVLLSLVQTAFCLRPRSVAVISAAVVVVC